VVAQVKQRTFCQPMLPSVLWRSSGDPDLKAGGIRSIGAHTLFVFINLHRRDEVHSAQMYKFFMSLKQPDGSFLVTHHAEVDVRYTHSLHVANLSYPDIPFPSQRNILHASHRNYIRHPYTRTCCRYSSFHRLLPDI
jgi:hypothetical protein